MTTPLLNFLAAAGIGLVVGVVGGFLLKGKAATAIWLAPLLAIVGALVASVLAYMFGDRADYGWKEASLQVVLAVVGVAITSVLAGRTSAVTSAK